MLCSLAAYLIEICVSICCGSCPSGACEYASIAVLVYFYCVNIRLCDRRFSFLLGFCCWFGANSLSACLCVFNRACRCRFCCCWANFNTVLEFKILITGAEKAVGHWNLLLRKLWGCFILLIVRLFPTLFDVLRWMDA